MPPEQPPRTPAAAAAAAPAPLLLSQARAYRYCGISRTRWYVLRASGQLPAPVELPDGALAWRRTDLEAWVEQLAQPGRRRRRPGRPTAAAPDGEGA